MTQNTTTIRPIIARLTSDQHLHALEIEKESSNARHMSDSLFYATNLEYLTQVGRRVAYLEKITDWETFESATTCDYNDLDYCVELALACTRERSIDEIIAREYTFDNERRNASYAHTLVGLCALGIASRTIDNAEIDPDKWDRRFQSLFKMAFMIAHECACFVKYSAQYADGQTLSSRCKIDAQDLTERFERLHEYLKEELTEG